jgi:hypothetical protein
MKKMDEDMGDFKGWICSDARFSWMNTSNSACLFGASGDLAVGSLAVGH